MTRGVPGSNDRDEYGARLAAYLAGAMSREERAAFEAETVSDPDLADELYAAQSLDAALEDAAPDAATARERPREATVSTAPSATPRRRIRPERLWHRGAWPVVLPLAAVVALVVLLPRWLGDGPPPADPVFRGEEAAITGLAPRGGVAELPDRFVWTSDSLAVRYRFELFDASGRLVHTAVVTDTVLTAASELFPAADLLSGSAPFWLVTPLAADGREGPSSPPVVFEIRAESP